MSLQRGNNSNKKNLNGIAGKLKKLFTECHSAFVTLLLESLLQQLCGGGGGTSPPSDEIIETCDVWRGQMEHQRRGIGIILWRQWLKCHWWRVAKLKSLAASLHSSVRRVKSLISPLSCSAPFSLRTESVPARSAMFHIVRDKTKAGANAMASSCEQH